MVADPYSCEPYVVQGLFYWLSFVDVTRLRSLVMFSLLGRYIKPIPATFVGVLIWHLVVNFSVWYLYGGNLLQTYIQAIPFDFNLLVSTLVCVLIGKLCINLYSRYYSY